MTAQFNTRNSAVLFLQRHSNSILYLATFFFLAGGMAYSLFKGNCLHFPDERQYLAIARNIAAGNGFSLDGINPTALFPPVIPLLMALFLKMGASLSVLHFVNFVFLTCSLYVIRSILRQEKAENGIAISVLLVLGYGVLFYTAGTLYPQTLYTLVLLLLVRCALDRNRDTLHVMIFGILCALLMMVHSTGAFIPPIAGLWIIFSSADRKTACKKVCASALVAIACLSIWWIRNYTIFHTFIPLTTHGGDTIYIGNNPHTSLTAWYNYVQNDFYQKVARLPEAEQNRLYLQKTIEFWVNQPGRAATLYCRKLAEYFNFYNDLYVSSEFTPLKKFIMFVTYYPLLLCLVIRLFFIKKVPLTSVEKLFVLIYGISALFHSLFIPRIRFRLPYDVILITHIGIMYSLMAGAMKRERAPLAADPSGPRPGPGTRWQKHTLMISGYLAPMLQDSAIIRRTPENTLVARRIRL